MRELRLIWTYIRTVFGHWWLITIEVVLVLTDVLERIFGTWLLPPLWVKVTIGVAVLMVAQYLAYRAEAQRLRATRISVDFRDGWYAHTAPNTAAPTTALVHLRLCLNIANRDGRDTTLSLKDLRIQEHVGLVVNHVKLFPESITPPTTPMTAVDIHAGRTLPTILEVRLTFPSSDPTPWGPTIGVQVDFGETFTNGPITLSADVPTTP